MENEELIKKVLEKNKEYAKSQIEISPYCKGRLAQRKINEEFVKKTILENKALFHVEVQNKEFKGKPEKRYKTIFKISNKYSLVIITNYSKVLKVISVYKTSKGVMKKWQNEVLE